MNIEKSIEAAELIISEIRSMSPVQRLIAYSAMKAILDEVEIYADEHDLGYVSATGTLFICLLTIILMLMLFPCQEQPA